MSYSISGTTIRLTRGDTFYCLVGITKNEQPYTPTEGDEVRFALKHKTMTASKKEFTDRSPLIKKGIPIDTMVLHLEPKDTKKLPFGEYVYDVQITFENGDVNTFIKEATFVIMPEVD